MVEEAEKQNTSEVAPEPSRFTTPPTSPAGRQGWSEKLKLCKWKILGGTLGLLVLVGAVFGAYKLGQRQIQPTPQPSPIISPSPTPDITANWKTYTNTKYGYSIKYPVDWSEQPKCEGGAVTDDYMCFLSPDFEESPAGAIMGSTVMGGVILIYGQGGIVGLPPNGFCAPEGPIYISECKEITVKDLQAMQRKIGETQTEIGILKNGKFILDIKAIYNAASKDEIIDTFNLMLSTFRFLSSSTPSPSTWKTYTNETYKFQIEYPSEMVLGPEPQAPDSELLSSRSLYYPEAANSIEEGQFNISVRTVPLDDMVASWEGLANKTATLTNLDGISAKKIEWVDTNRTDGINLYNQKILFTHNNLTYEISLYVDNDGPKKNELLTIFNQMLSTFRFLD